MNANQHPQPGTKQDANKPQPALVLHSMSRAIQAVVEVATFGAGKYSPDNWLLVPDGINRYSNAKLRHMLDSATEDCDPESGLLHAAHEAWNALAVLEMMLRDAQTAPADRGESLPSHDDWEAGEKRMDIIGPNGPTGEHYPDYTGFVDGYGTIEIGDHLPELGGYLIGFIGGHGIIMPDDEFIGVSFYSAFDFAANLDAIADGGARGFNDWRVPTKDELNLAWINREKLAGLSMSQDIYWSATELSANYAWNQSFHDGLQSNSNKNNSYRVRPVRSVPLDQLASAKE